MMMGLYYWVFGQQSGPRKKYRYVNNHSGSDFDFYYISI